MEKQYTSNCKNCKHFRLSEPLKKRMCDFWNREVEKDIQICVAYETKKEET